MIYRILPSLEEGEVEPLLEAHLPNRAAALDWARKHLTILAPGDDYRVVAEDGFMARFVRTIAGQWYEIGQG